MCTTLWFPQSQLLIETQGDLAMKLGGFEYVVYEGGGHASAEDADCCLCPIALQAIANKARWTLEDDSMDAIVLE